MSAAAPIAAKSMSTAMNRVDGRLKVTGAAKYAAEFNPPNMAYAFLVMSPIAKGTITSSIRSPLKNLQAYSLLSHTRMRQNSLNRARIGPKESELRSVSHLPMQKFLMAANTSPRSWLTVWKMRGTRPHY
jgi:hypothetical protein